ncbi:MAG: hypothetical protein QXU18_00285 [Thermoplasmatales archaeon]
MREKMDRIEVVSGNSAMHALTKAYSGSEYDWERGVEDPYRIIGYEVIKQIEDSGQSLENNYVRVWIGDHPFLTMTRMPRAESDVWNGGLISVDIKENTNLIMRLVFGVMMYFESSFRINQLERPLRQITEDDFFSRALQVERMWGQ